ncbi:hypothetical protein RDI58_003981 [Solanum bulbocastanum]|uniref:Uncharacterized protein n=1 Tax=Solanum bulbocastanum TaxID=147425 RepID=A0AAN8TYB2_SOLBU
MSVAMRWHATGRPNEGNLRHPTDEEAWKDFDSLHPSFSNHPRNVKFVLSNDGFNPFRTMSISHETWTIMLTNYNLCHYGFASSQSTWCCQ